MPDTNLWPDLDRWTDLNSWIADLANTIAHATAQDPMSPDYEYRTGVVMLGFTVYPDGGIADIRVVGSSGDDSLDRRAVAKLRRADPLPAGPDDARPRAHVAVVSVAERIVKPVRRVVSAEKRSLAAA